MAAAGMWSYNRPRHTQPPHHGNDSQQRVFLGIDGDKPAECAQDVDDRLEVGEVFDERVRGVAPDLDPPVTRLDRGRLRRLQPGDLPGETERLPRHQRVRVYPELQLPLALHERELLPDPGDRVAGEPGPQ